MFGWIKSSASRRWYSLRLARLIAYLDSFLEPTRACARSYHDEPEPNLDAIDTCDASRPEHTIFQTETANNETPVVGLLVNVVLDDAQPTIVGRLNTKIFEHSTGAELGGQPARLFSASRPSLGGLCRISIFWEYLRVGASRVLSRPARQSGGIKLA